MLRTKPLVSPHRAACAVLSLLLIYLIFWYRSTNTDAKGAGSDDARPVAAALYEKFGNTEQVLSLLALLVPYFSGTEVQILLFWYRSTNTDS